MKIKQPYTMEDPDLPFIENYNIPLFVPFNIRNKMIDETGKDLNEIKPNKQYETLLSYMPKEDIFRGIEKKFSRAKAPFNVRKVNV